MNTVHVIQDVPGKNILPAKDFGELRVILTGKETREEAICTITQHLLKTWEHGDYLLLIGNPIYIGVAFHVVAAMKREIPVLVWDRHQYKYNAESVIL